jgi:hypothetical protein
VTVDPACESADRLAIRHLVDHYGVAIDGHACGDFEMLFSPEAVLRVMPENRRPPVEFRGREQLRGLCEMVGHACQATLHFVGNHVVVLDGDTAMADTYCTAHHVTSTVGPDGNEVVLDEVMAIRYADSFARTDAGWLFVERTAHRLWSYGHPVATSPLVVDYALRDAAVHNPSATPSAR